MTSSKSPANARELSKRDKIIGYVLLKWSRSMYNSKQHRERLAKAMTVQSQQQIHKGNPFMLLLKVFFKFFYMICWTRKLKCVVHISSMHSWFELRCVIFWPDFLKMDFLKQSFLNISIYTSIIDIILSPKFFCDPVFVFYERVL